MVLWNGACMVHEIFSLRKLKSLRYVTQMPSLLRIQNVRTLCWRRLII